MTVAVPRVLNCRIDPVAHAALPLHPIHQVRNHGLAAQLPPSTENRASDVPIRDQGQRGSCTAFCWTGVSQAQYALEGKDAGELAELSQYQWELIDQGTPGQDVGSTVTRAALTSIRRGFALDVEYPYSDTSDLSVAPPQNVVQAAAARRLPRWAPHRVHQDLAALKLLIYAKRRVGFAAQLTQDFMTDDPVWKGPQPGSPIIGGHAIALIDYDDTAFGGFGGFWIRNSWGVSFGAAGYRLVPYSWILSGAVGDMIALAAMV